MSNSPCCRTVKSRHCFGTLIAMAPMVPVRRGSCGLSKGQMFRPLLNEARVRGEVGPEAHRGRAQQRTALAHLLDVMQEKCLADLHARSPELDRPGSDP